MSRFVFLAMLATCVWAATSRPNVVLIVTDDLDLVLGGMQPLAFTQQLVANRGATFVNAFTTSPICCPSRASILSGSYAHNHRTFNNSESGGCYGPHWREVVEPAAFSKRLQENGYRTFYAGKYLNEYKAKEQPPGWSEWAGLKGNSRYRDFVLNENGRLVTYGGDSYLTDVLANKTNEFLARTATPFFAMVSPPAPHAPFDPAIRHSGRFSNVSAPRTPNFNSPSGPLDKHWLLTMPPGELSPQVIGHIDEIYRKRWETLLAVDEMVEGIVSSLGRRNLLDNTFVVFTSDNGYHMGQFAQAYDKRQPYDTDIRVPLLVAGPGVPAKSLVHAPVALIDLAPTILEWTGTMTNDQYDGKSFAPFLTAAAEMPERQILIEYWGEGNEHTYSPECPWSAKDRLNQCTADADCHCQDSGNNTFSCVRHLAGDQNLLYCEFQDEVQFVEAYDLAGDLYQTTNLGFDMLPSLRAHYSLAVDHLAKCVGESCRRVY